MTSITIIGAGAIGKSLYVYLRSFELSVMLFSRSILSSPVHIEGSIHGTIDPTEVHLLTTNSTVKSDLVLIITKAYDLEDLFPELKTHIPISTPIVFCQNGLGVYEQAARALPMHTIGRLLISYGASYHDHNRIKTFGAPLAVLGAQQRSDEILKIIQACKITVSDLVSPDQAEWKKMAVMVSVVAIAAAFNETNDAIVKNPEAAVLSRLVLEELRLVAAAEGYQDTVPSFERLQTLILPFAENRSSLLSDLTGSGDSELEWLITPVITLATKHRLDTPSLLALHRRLMHQFPRT